MSDILYPLRRVHGALHEKRLAFQNYTLKLLLPLGKKYFILGTPTHTNIGDSAIVLAEQLFVEKVIGDRRRIKELTVAETQANARDVFKCIRASRRHVVCWPGGGNLGDQWFPEEEFRRRAMGELPGNPMVLFPQTLYYTPTEMGRKEERASIAYYNGRPGLTMVAREQKSYDEMGKLYPDTEVLLTPDIVLSCTMNDLGAVKQARQGTLFCMRSDAEKAVDSGVWRELSSMLEGKGISCRTTDMYADHWVTKENRLDSVREKMQQFCGAQLVITDRLHGMVFAAITGTPCVVFGNYNHKVKGTYDWIKYLPYIKYVETVEEAKACIPELLAMEDCQYDNTPLKPYFEKLAEVVKEKCR